MLRRLHSPISIGRWQASSLVRAMDEGQSIRYDDFKGVTFYSDSINDLPLLEAVEFPKAVNPDAKLEAISL